MFETKRRGDSPRGFELLASNYWLQTMTVPCSAADRNKVAIGDALAPYFENPDSGGDKLAVLEIGSGAGQHAGYLCERFHHLVWQPTDQASHFDALQTALSRLSISNLCQPVEIEVDATAADPALLEALPITRYPFVYSANTAHIMGIEQVASMFTIVSRVLTDDGMFALYGPFKIDGQHTSEGNHQFDQALRLDEPCRGIRDKEELQTLATNVGLHLSQDITMPTNNRILLWARST